MQLIKIKQDVHAQESQQESLQQVPNKKPYLARAYNYITADKRRAVGLVFAIGIAGLALYKIKNSVSVVS